jgi:hypothetical protein
MSEAETIARALKGRKTGAGCICSLLVRCHKGCSFDDVMAALRSRGLLKEERPRTRSAADIIAGMAARAARPARRTYSIEETFMAPEAQVEPLRRGRAWNPLEYERSHIYHDATGNPCRLVLFRDCRTATKTWCNSVD